MKNIILILCLSFIVFSCSKDENNEPTVNFPEHLIGKWKMTACYDGSDTDNTQTPCDVQVTKNIYDIWFKTDGTYISKTYYSCDDTTCKYVVNRREVEGYPDYFKIIFNPDIECNYPCVNWASILSISENKLTLSYPNFFVAQEITYTRVE